MSVASLLNHNAPNYSFDHDQLHRNMVGAIPGSPSVTTAPYLLDPLIGADVPAGWWDTEHSAAHRDFAIAFPSIYWPTTVSISDIDLSSGPAEWWAMSNWNLHNLAASVLPTFG